MTPEKNNDALFNDIRTIMAKHFYDCYTNQLRQVIDESRLNKGGSMTVPKSLTEDLLELTSIPFSNLEFEQGEQYYRLADGLIENIKVLM
jgi:hypothetical protein